MSIETLEIIHTASQLATMPFAIAFSMWYSSRYEIDRTVAIKYSATFVFILYIFSHSWRWFGDLIDFPIAVNSARTFLFIPIFTWLLSKVWNIDMLRGADFTAPLSFFARGICLIGCTMIGCGQAVPCEWGIYSPNYGCRVFPMDLIDLLATFAIGIISLIYAKRLDYKGNGRVFALAMICLGVVRSLIQFGSTDRYFGIRGFNDETIISIISIIMGTMIFQIYENKVKFNGGLDNENK